MRQPELISLNQSSVKMPYCLSKGFCDVWNLTAWFMWQHLWKLMMVLLSTSHQSFQLVSTDICLSNIISFLQSILPFMRKCFRGTILPYSWISCRWSAFLNWTFPSVFKKSVYFRIALQHNRYISCSLEINEVLSVPICNIMTILHSFKLICQKMQTKKDSCKYNDCLFCRKSRTRWCIQQSKSCLRSFG